jgi:hypothetical protein
MSNLVDASPRLWAPAIFAYIFTYATMQLLTAEYKAFVVLRKKFVSQRVSSSGPRDSLAVKRHSVMVENIPERLQSDAALYAFFDKLFPGDVKHAVVTQNLGALDEMLARRENVLAKLEAAVARTEGNKREGNEDYKAEHREGGWCGARVGSVAFYSAELHTLNDQVERLQREHLEAAAKINDEFRAAESEGSPSTASTPSGSVDSSIDGPGGRNLMGFTAKVGKAVTRNVVSSATGVLNDVIKVSKAATGKTTQLRISTHHPFVVP